MDLPDAGRQGRRGATQSAARAGWGLDKWVVQEPVNSAGVMEHPVAEIVPRPAPAVAEKVLPLNPVAEELPDALPVAQPDLAGLAAGAAAFRGSLIARALEPLSVQPATLLVHLRLAPALPAALHREAAASVRREPARGVEPMASAAGPALPDARVYSVPQSALARSAAALA